MGVTVSEVAQRGENPDGILKALNLYSETIQKTQPSYDVPLRGSRLADTIASRAVNYLERKTGLDLDRDGDVGIAGNAAGAGRVAEPGTASANAPAGDQVTTTVRAEKLGVDTTGDGKILCLF